MYVHGGHDYTVIIHLSIISIALLLGSVLRSKIKILRKYLVPAPMIGGVFLFLFYNYIASYFQLESGRVFLEELIFHMLNISFIAMQLRIPEKQEKPKRKNTLWCNVTALLGEYGLQCFLGLLVCATLLSEFLPGNAKCLGLTLCLGFELGPGQAESIAIVWENAPYNVKYASDVGLSMAAIGFVIGSVVGVFFINLAAKNGWIDRKYVEKLRKKNIGNGFLRDKENRTPTSYLTTVSESMDSFTLHIALILFTYFLSFCLLAGLEHIVRTFIGGTVLEAVTGLWGINFVVSSLCAIIVRRLLIRFDAGHVIDNQTCNRIDGVAVDFTIVACLGAIEVATIREYWFVILILTFVGMLITCVLTPLFCSRLFEDYTFLRFLMIFGTANGTLPTALSLIRVLDPDFETPVAQEYVNSTGVMFVFALPILGLCNWGATTDKLWYFIAITFVYIVVSFILYIKLAGKRAFAGGGIFYNPKK